MESLEYSRSKVSPLIIEIAKKASNQLNGCPICGCGTLWLKEIRMTDMHYEVGRDMWDGHAWTEYSILYKCDNCAYVNTTLPLKVKVKGVYTIMNLSYEHFSPEPEIVQIGGKVVPVNGYRFIGHGFWNIPDVRLPDIRCFCGRELKITSINPFFRNEFGGIPQYRCDITCTCGKHVLAFGVHISPDEYITLLER